MHRSIRICTSVLLVAFAGAAFAVVYLPFTPSWLDLFGKVGRAWLWSPYTSVASIQSLGFTFVNDVQNTEKGVLAYGGGMQVHFGAFALRTEYELISTAIGDPSLVTVGVTWTP